MCIFSNVLKTPQSLRQCALVMVISGSLFIVCGIILLTVGFISSFEAKWSVFRWEGVLSSVIGLTLVFGSLAVFTIAKHALQDEPTSYCVDEMQTQMREQNTLSYLQATDVDLVTGTDMEVQVITKRSSLPYKHYAGNVRGFPGGYINQF